MGKDELRKRLIWQDSSGPQADIAEKKFYEVFLRAFEGTDYEIVSKPKEFNNIYSDVKLTPEVQAGIYNPEGEVWRHGIIPDYAIVNSKTGKTLYVEVKRQDGWVEGKKRNAGRGNAHERSNKFFTPGLLKILRERGKLGDNVLPFWVVFQGDIARDPKRVREITLWYDGYNDHFFMWSSLADDQALLNHFEKKLKRLLH